MSPALLIADDDPAILTVVDYAARLTWPDCRVTTAGNGDETLRRFAEEPPDLVILDVAMPPPDGYAVLGHIRRTSPVPVLMLTVHDRAADRARAFELGATDYLTKPFDHHDLLARLRALAPAVS